MSVPENLVSFGRFWSAETVGVTRHAIDSLDRPQLLLAATVLLCAAVFLRIAGALAGGVSLALLVKMLMELGRMTLPRPWSMLVFGAAVCVGAYAAWRVGVLRALLVRAVLVVVISALGPGMTVRFGEWMLPSALIVGLLWPPGGYWIAVIVLLLRGLGIREAVPSWYLLIGGGLAFAYHLRAALFATPKVKGRVHASELAGPLARATSGPLAAIRRGWSNAF